MQFGSGYFRSVFILSSIYDAKQCSLLIFSSSGQVAELEHVSDEQRGRSWKISGGSRVLKLGIPASKKNTKHSSIDFKSNAYSWD